MTEYYYDVAAGKHLQTLGSLKKELLESFVTFDSKVFEEGAIPKKYKELIAVAAAHITRCPYCIEGHTRRANRTSPRPCARDAARDAGAGVRASVSASAAQASSAPVRTATASEAVTRP